MPRRLFNLALKGPRGGNLFPRRRAAGHRINARFILGAGTQFSRATICEAVHSRREQRKSSFPKPSSTEREKAAPDDPVQLLAEGQRAGRIRNKATSTPI